MPRTYVDPTQISSRRVKFALLALAIGAFGIGTTEFVAMGLLPEIARDLLPEVAAANPAEANAQAGWLVTIYALGVVIGAPTISALTARFSRKSVLFWLAIAFTLGTIGTALLPSFEMILVARFIAGLPHGAFFGTAALVAARLMGPENRGKGITLVMSGLSVSNIVGVPLATMIGQALGWRSAFLLVAGIFALTAVAVAVAMPRVRGNKDQTLRRELAVFRRGQVWFQMGIGAIGFGGFFAVYAYLSPLATEVGGLDASHVPWILATMGVGMTVGTLTAGPMIDRSVRGTLYFGFVGMLAMLVLLYFVAGWAPTLFLAIFLIGFVSAGIGPAVQTRLMDVAGDAQAIAAALNHSSMNIGNALGAFLGGLVIGAGMGYLAPIIIAMILTVLGIIIVAVSYLVPRLRARV